MKPKTTGKSRNPAAQDATLINVRALKAAVRKLADRVATQEELLAAYAATLRGVTERLATLESRSSR
jgi:hypothetical protein